MALRNRYAVIHGVEDAGLIALIVGRLTRAKVIFEKHSDPHSHRKGRLSRTVLRAYAAVERLVMRRVDAVIGTGAGLVQQARKHAPQTPAYHISDIPSSLVEAGAAEVAAARERMQAEPGAVLALYVGSFAVYQGIDLLFGAMPPALGSSDKLKFVVVGGTPEQIAERRGQLAALGVAERVLFLGMISPDELPAYLAACDILLSPRVAGVNTPLKLLDYLKARRAIVATDHEANRLIVDESCARLAPLTAEGLADAIVTLAEDSSERERLAQAGARLIEERYNFEVFVSELKRCYDGLAK
jgi:glycosyltransferase involved in cell wall biosynthesis